MPTRNVNVRGCSIMVLGLVMAATASEAFGQASAIAKMAEPQSSDTSLPNVLLIGDSISIGYTVAVRKALRGQANVYRPPTNCGPTSKGVAEMDRWLGDRKWDVIHFNFGLHDLKYMGPKGKNLADPQDPANSKQVSPAEYVANLTKIVKRLKQTGAKLIWRETTPVPEGAQGRIADDSVFYNQLADEVMRAEGGVATDPMHAYASEPDIAAQQRPANVHYTAEGSRQLAKAVAEALRASIKR